MAEKHFALFHRKENFETKMYDKTLQKPMIKCSICNGEQVAGFRNRRTGAFEEVMLISDVNDLNIFCNTYGIKETIEKFY